MEYLATHIAQLEAANPNTLVVSAGDLIGASPLLSALFHDEPTIEAMNLLGLDFNAVGDHEFDEGAADPNGTYRITVNSFLAEGGDNFTLLAQGSNRLGGAVDLDALVDYFAANSPVPPGPQTRITRAS